MENANIYKHDITSVQDLLTQLDELRDHQGFERIWFRGVADSSYGLEPSIFRRNVNPALEKELYN